MKYKVGDILKPKKGHEDDCVTYSEEKGEYIVIISIKNDDRYFYDIYSNSECVSKCSDCFNHDDLELVTPDISKPSMKKRYVLLLDTPVIKKGAIYEEVPDNPSYFTLITPEHDKFPDDDGAGSAYRESIVNNPEWYKEVVHSSFTKEQREEIIKIIKTTI